MKLKQGALWIGVILAAVATVLMIVLPGSANLYAAYVFCLIGIGMIVAGVWAADKNVPASYALWRQVRWFLPVSLLISVVVLVLQGMKVIVIPVVWHCIAQGAMLAFVAIRVIAVYSGKQYIEDIDARVAGQRNRLAAMVNAASALQQKVSAMPDETRVEAVKALKQVVEGLRYSDPMSTAAVEEIDSEIENGLSHLKELCGNGNEAQFIAKCEEMCALIRERGDILKTSKS